MSIYIVEPNKLNEVIAGKLKEYTSIKPPEGSEFWKTAYFKELAPSDTEAFWYIRCASLLRKVRKYGPIGVNKLRKLYGGKNKNRQGKKKSARAAGKIIRVALQQLEEAKLLTHQDKVGRTCTPDGISLLERTSYEILRQKNQ
ncbi:MAG: 40S ribosomal protein S19 [Candidatus Lokiarchaeota archaeon]|nr:40S ribosomal protein S19 [Candidatus Lokiarchaeota archaeon]